MTTTSDIYSLPEAPINPPEPSFPKSNAHLADSAMDSYFGPDLSRYESAHQVTLKMLEALRCKLWIINQKITAKARISASVEGGARRKQETQLANSAGRTTRKD